MKYIKSNFLVLECKPENSTHPQGNRVLECFEFSTTNLRIKGQPRFNKFKAVMSMPQDGAKFDSEVEVISQEKNSFEVKLINPSTSVIDKISWWFKKEIDFVESKIKTKKIGQDSDISA